MLDIDECLSNPCHTGLCIDGINRYTCQCPASMTGTTCDTGKYRIVITRTWEKISIALKL